MIEESPKEPVMIWQGLVIPALLAITLFFHLNGSVQGAVDALLLAIGGAIAAYGVEHRSVFVLLGGLAKAVFALLLAFGFHTPDNVQVGTLALISVVVAFVTQSQVRAKPAAIKE